MKTDVAAHVVLVSIQLAAERLVAIQGIGVLVGCLVWLEPTTTTAVQ